MNRKSTSISSYSELLKDIRWQDKRQEILIRDNFHCASCLHKGDDVKQLGENLEVHHLIYKKGLLPWEYEDSDLITLCDSCHDFITKKISSCTELVRRICVDDDVSEQLEYLLLSISIIENPWEIRRIAKKIQNG